MQRGTMTFRLDKLVELLAATVDGDLAAAGTALLDGALTVDNPLGFALPSLPASPRSVPLAPHPRHTLLVTDRLVPADPAVTRLVPPTLVIGIGSARGVPGEAVAATLQRLETEHGFDLRAIRAYASVDLKAAEVGILAAIAPAPLRTYPAAALAVVAVPNPSEVVRAEAGTSSVAEAAALHAARDLAPDAPVELVVEKIKSDHVTVAAVRIRPRGRLAIGEATRMVAGQMVTPRGRRWS